jgi:hypothetical protein
VNVDQRAQIFVSANEQSRKFDRGLVANSGQACRAFRLPVCSRREGLARNPSEQRRWCEQRSVGVAIAGREGMSFLRTVSLIVGGALVALGGSALSLLM